MGGMGDGEHKRNAPQPELGGVVTLQVGPGRPDGRYSAASVVADAIVDQSPTPLFVGARFTARRR